VCDVRKINLIVIGVALTIISLFAIRAGLILTRIKSYCLRSSSTLFFQPFRKNLFSESFDCRPLSFAHLYFLGGVVIVFTLIGGLIFSLTYLKTQSLLVITIEHTMYGSVILASALGEQFYKAFFIFIGFDLQ
jgi:hypothetical protein